MELLTLLLGMENGQPRPAFGVEPSRRHAHQTVTFGQAAVMFVEIEQHSHWRIIRLR